MSDLENTGNLRLGRRSLLQSLGVAAIGISLGGLAACGKKEEKAAAGGATKIAPTGEEPKLNFYNWDTYIGETTLADFQAAGGAAVNMTLFASNDELFAKLRAGNAGYDVIDPRDIDPVYGNLAAAQALIEETLYSLDVMSRDLALRMAKDVPLRTDEGHYILDLSLTRIGNPRQLALVLNQIPGVVENGLFIDICDVVVIGHGDGRVTVRDINSGRVETGSVDMSESRNIFADLD